MESYKTIKGPGEALGLQLFLMEKVLNKKGVSNQKSSQGSVGHSWIKRGGLVAET